MIESMAFMQAPTFVVHIQVRERSDLATDTNVYGKMLELLQFHTWKNSASPMSPVAILLLLI